LRVFDRDLLGREFDAAVVQLDQLRDKPMLTTEFYRSIGDSLFDAGYQALKDFVVHYTPFGGGPCDRMHVISAPVGSGKTSFSIAFVAALDRGLVVCKLALIEQEAVLDWPAADERFKRGGVHCTL